MTDRIGQGSQPQRPGRGPDAATVTVRVPITLRKRGGRKRILAPDGTDAPTPSASGQVSTLIKALARAHRWQHMLETGDYASIGDLAAAERINPSYLARVLRLTLLAPKVIEAILEGRANPPEPLSGLVEWNLWQQGSTSV